MSVGEERGNPRQRWFCGNGSSEKGQGSTALQHSGLRGLSSQGSQWLVESSLEGLLGSRTGWMQKSECLLPLEILIGLDVMISIRLEGAEGCGSCSLLQKAQGLLGSAFISWASSCAAPAPALDTWSCPCCCALPKWLEIDARIRCELEMVADWTPFLHLQHFPGIGSKWFYTFS